MTGRTVLVPATQVPATLQVPATHQVPSTVQVPRYGSPKPACTRPPT